jgi:hypothetical protein
MTKPGNDLPGSLEAMLYRVGHGAMIDKGGDCFLRHRVDRIRSNQRLDVEQVWIIWVLCARAGPKQPLCSPFLGG